MHHFFYGTNVSIYYYVFSCAAPGAFNISNVTFVSSRVANITLKKVSTYILLVLLCNYYTVRDSAGDKWQSQLCYHGCMLHPTPPLPTFCPQVSLDCPSFPTKWYIITIRGDDGASLLRKQVEATPFNDSVTISVLFDTPLPQGLLNVEVFKIVAIPVKELSEEGNLVITDSFQEWNSSSTATGKRIHTQTTAEEEMATYTWKFWQLILLVVFITLSRYVQSSCSVI